MVFLQNQWTLQSEEVQHDDDEEVRHDVTHDAELPW